MRTRTKVAIFELAMALSIGGCGIALIVWHVNGYVALGAFLMIWAHRIGDH